MKKEIWESIIDYMPIINYPTLPCPYCKEDTLNLEIENVIYRKVTCDKTSSLIQKETLQRAKEVTDIFEKNQLAGVFFGILSVVEHKNKIPSKFIGFLSCSNCSGQVSATGTAQFITNNAANTKEPLPHPIKIEYFSPPIPIFNVSDNVPKEIFSEVLQAFNHFHSDLNSSGAKLRHAIEKICAELGYKEKNLHATITSMTKNFPKEAKHLHSIKLLGNEASHAGGVEEEDLLNAFAVLEYVLGVFDRIKEEEALNLNSNKLIEKFDKKASTKQIAQRTVV